MTQCTRRVDGFNKSAKRLVSESALIASVAEVFAEKNGDALGGGNQAFPNPASIVEDISFYLSTAAFLSEDFLSQGEVYVSKGLDVFFTGELFFNELLKKDLPDDILCQFAKAVERTPDHQSVISFMSDVKRVAPLKSLRH